MSRSHREHIYGINSCFEVVRAGKRTVFGAYLNKTSTRNPRIRKLFQFLERTNIPLHWVDKQQLTSMAGSRDHQGAVLETTHYPYRRSDDLWGEPPILLLDNVEDPHNVGAILRSAEIFGFTTVLLPIRGVPDIYPSVVKVAAGATEFLNIAKDASANSYVRSAKSEDYSVIALDMSGAVDIRDLRVKLPPKFMVVIGGEDRSVGQYILNNADHVTSIHQHGKINSLNASVAAAISLFALQKVQ